MKENIVKNKSFLFAVNIVNLYKFLCENKNEFILSKQLLRSGTSVGALIREAEQAESKTISNIKWVLHKKKSMKQFIGLNY